ncbi:MAG: hypothetical protein ABR552_03000, partial [Actinomycetota bacterium]
MVGSKVTRLRSRALLFTLLFVAALPIVFGIAWRAHLLEASSGPSPAAHTKTNSTAGSEAGNLDQCANGPLASPARCIDTQWVNGNLGASKAHYFEGDSIPYRLVMTGVPTTGSHTVTIQWDALKAGKHAIDYITSFNRTETNADPCHGVSGCSLSTFSSANIQPQPDVVAAGITQPPSQVLKLFGGHITNVSSYTTDQSSTDHPTSITITFTANSTNPLVLAWGGHIADHHPAPIGWGVGNSAVNIPGSPYHMRLVDLDGKGGNQDRSLSADAVIFPASITITKVAPAGPTVFGFTATALTPSTFSLDVNNDPTYSNQRIFDRITTFDTKTVTENDPSPLFSLTGLSCTEDQSQDSTPSLATRTATIRLQEGENVSCTFTNSSNLGTLHVIKHVINDQDGTASAGSFSLHVKKNGTDVSGSPAAGAESPGTSYTLLAGTYSVSEETPPSIYTQSFGSDCPNGSVTVTAGADTTCTITNNDTNIAPAVTVDKTATPDHINEPGGTVTFSVTVANGSVSTDPVTLTSLADDVYGHLLDTGNAAVTNNTCPLIDGASIDPGTSITCHFDGAVSGNAG